MAPEIDPHRLRPGHHPTPFTAAEIRAGSPLGRTIRQLVEADGRPPETRAQQYVAVDADAGTRLVFTLDGDGTHRDVRRSRSRWIDLQAHASMLAATTTIAEVDLETPMGPLACLRYTAIDGDAVETFWFARSLPGMPVMTERRQGGRLVERVTMLSSRVEPLPDELPPGS